MVLEDCYEDAWEYCNDLTYEELRLRGYKSWRDCINHIKELCETFENEIEFECVLDDDP